MPVTKEILDKYIKKNREKKFSINNLFKSWKTIFYYPETGIKNFTLPIHTNLQFYIADTFFKTLNDLDIEYYLFAGSAIGKFRNNKNIPWVDDYDIIIFEKDSSYYIDTVAKELDKYGFKTELSPIKGGGIYTTTFEFENRIFLFDVFISYIDSKNYVKNTALRGRYTKKKITIDMIRPAKYLYFDKFNYKIPFFNKWEEDIKKEYGDVIGKVDIHFEHKKGTAETIIKKNYREVYKDFDIILNRSIENTKNKVITQKHSYENKLVVNEKFKLNNRDEILNYINRNNIKDIFIFEEFFLDYVLSIKYYFPKINIYVYILNEEKIFNPILLNNVDTIRFANKKLFDKYNQYYFNNRPNFELIEVITFGTFDLLHKGHLNIFQKSKEISSRLIVGVSTDEFNSVKNKKSHESFSVRSKNVKNNTYVDEVFPEESFEMKQSYIDNHNANLVVMGSDWEDKFDFVTVPTIYFDRTEGISSTMLRDALKKEKEED